jgi:hypothetical protein
MSTTDGLRVKGSRSALFGYAVLRANYNHNAPNYLDNFTGFVVDVLAQRHPEPLDENVVGQALRETFGLTIPDRVAGVLLKRAVKDGKAESSDQKHFTLSSEALGQVVSLEVTMSKYEQAQSELLSKFVAYVRDRHPDRLVLVEAQPDLHLHNYIERHAVPLLTRAVRGKRGDQGQALDLNGSEYLVAAFIATLVESDGVTFGYVVDAVKGAILTGVLDLGPGDIHRKLRDLTIVLDTPVLLAALGCMGETQQRAVQQTLGLARTLHVKAVCFEHTEREIDGVLDSVVSFLRNRGKFSGVHRAVDAHFVDIGATPADIAVEQDRLRASLQALGVRVLPKPDGYATYGLDEVALDELLREQLPSMKDGTRRFDVESLSAVHRMREGASPEHFERCRFVLVTSNFGLVQAARHVDERHRWPLAMLDSDLAALLWVRSPAVAEDLPREQLLATVYAGMQPGSHLWVKYVEEIARLEQIGGVEPDEAFILRSRPEARRALMDITLGHADGVDAEAIGTVVERVRESLEAPMRVVVDLAQGERDEALRTAQAAEVASLTAKVEIDSLKGRLASLEKQGSEQASRITVNSQKAAMRVVLALNLLFAAILIVPAALKLAAPNAVAKMPQWVGLACLAGAVTIVVIGAVRHFVGGSVKDWLRPIEVWLARRLEQRAQRRAGLVPL